MLTKKALGLMIGALLSGALIGGEAAAGQTLADFHSKMGGCASCHGTNAVTAASVRLRSTARITVAVTWGYQYRPMPRSSAGMACTSKQATALPRLTSA